MVIVGLLELGTEFHAHGELVVGIAGVFVLDGTKDLIRVDLLAALEDDCVANLTDENKQAGWRVVVLRVGPDQQNGVHDGDEALGDFGKFERGVDELVEVLLQGLEILEVLIGFQSRDMDLLLKLAESTGLRRLVLLQELEHLLDALAGELLADGVQVRALVLPEVDLSKGIGVNSLLEGLLGVLAELSLDLFGPVADGILKDGGLVLGRGLLGLGHVRGGQRQRGLALNETKGYLSVGEELMEFLHEVLADQVGPADLIEGVSQNWEENFL